MLQLFSVFSLSVMQVMPLGPFPYLMNVLSIIMSVRGLKECGPTACNRPYAIQNSWGMTGDMLSFHDLLHCFCWQCGKRVQVIQTIMSIIWMASSKEVGDHPGSEK